MARIQTRSPSGGEFSFYSPEELTQAVSRGSVTREWEVYHAATGKWLPITHHPAFPQRLPPRPTRRIGAPRPSDLVLIFPDPSRPADSGAGTSNGEPRDGSSSEVGTEPRRRYSRAVSQSTGRDREWSTAVRPSGRVSAPAPIPTDAPVTDSARQRMVQRVLLGILLLLLFMVGLGSLRHRKAPDRATTMDTVAPSLSPNTTATPAQRR